MRCNLRIQRQKVRLVRFKVRNPNVNLEFKKKGGISRYIPVYSQNFKEKN